MKFLIKVRNWLENALKFIVSLSFICLVAWLTSMRITVFSDSLKNFICIALFLSISSYTIYFQIRAIYNIGRILEKSFKRVAEEEEMKRSNCIATEQQDTGSNKPMEIMDGGNRVCNVPAAVGLSAAHQMLQ